MKEIITRLHENRQIQLAKEILESNGYKVSKKMDENSELPDYILDSMFTIQDMLDSYGGIELFSMDREGTEEIDIPCQMLNGDYKNVYCISDQDEEGNEVLEFFRDLDKTQIDKKSIPYVGYMILNNTSIGKYVYQNLSGMESIFIKK